MDIREYHKNTRLISMENEMDTTIIWYIIGNMFIGQDSQDK